MDFAHARHAMSAGTLALIFALRANGAPPLSDRIPASAIFYAGWAGTSAIPGFADTHLGHLMGEIDMQVWLRETVLRKHPEAQGQPVLTDLQDLARLIATHAWTNPSAVYSLGKGVAEDLSVKPHFCFLIDFGSSDAASNAEKDIQGRLDQIVQGNAIPDIRLTRGGSTLCLDAFSTTDRKPLENLGEPLSKAPAFTAAIKQVGLQTSAGFVYANLPALWPVLDEQNESNPDYTRNVAILGLKSATVAALSFGPEGPDWRSRLFIGMPANASGLAGVLATSRPASVDLLAGVPAIAASVTTFSIDPDRVFEAFKREGDLIKPGFGAQSEAITGLAGGILGIDARGFLRGLGSTVSVISIPVKGEPATFEFAVMLCPDDASKSQAQLDTLVRGVQRFLLAQKPDAPRPTTRHVEGITTLSAGPVNVAWAAAGNRIYVARNADVLKSLLEQRSSTLAQTTACNAMIARLAAPAGATLSLTQYAKAFDASIGAWVFESAQTPSKVPEDIRLFPWPAPDTLRAEQALSASATWVDAAGLHYDAFVPYPGAEALHPAVTLFLGPDSLQRRFKSLP